MMSVNRVMTHDFGFYSMTARSFWSCFWTHYTSSLNRKRKLFKIIYREQ